MADNQGTQDPSTEGNQSKSETRQYGIYKAITGTATEIKKAVLELLGGDESDQTTVMLKVAVAVEENPRKAMMTAANLKKLNGTFKVIADGSMTEYPVETETKTVTKIGKSESGD